MTRYPEPPDRLNDNRDHWHDGSPFADHAEYHAALGGYEEPPAAWEVADLEEDEW